MFVIGLDTAGNRIHAVGVDECGKFRFTDKETPKTHDRLKDTNPDVRRTTLYRSARTMFREYEELGGGKVRVHICCEEPISMRNGKTNRILALAAGAIWAAHLDFEVYWHWVAIPSWKQFIGNGNASKGEVMMWSICHGGDADWEEDYHDAYAIAQYGLQMIEQMIAVE